MPTSLSATMPSMPATTSLPVFLLTRKMISVTPSAGPSSFPMFTTRIGPRLSSSSPRSGGATGCRHSSTFRFHPARSAASAGAEASAARDRRPHSGISANFVLDPRGLPGRLPNQSGDWRPSFPGNLVPIDPNAVPLLPQFPFPTTGSSRGSWAFNKAVPTPTNWREELFRIDHNINSKLHASVRYIHDSWNRSVRLPFGPTPQPIRRFRLPMDSHPQAWWPISPRRSLLPSSTSS